MSKSDLSFVRTEMLPEQAPPVTEQGVVKWLRENLFAGPINTVMTLISLVVIYKILAGITPWLANGVWTTSSLAECREVLQGQTGGCFSVLTERWNQLLFGFKYPVEEYWRPTLAFVLLMVAITPVLFQELPRLFVAAAAVIATVVVVELLAGAAGLAVPTVVIGGLGYWALARFGVAQWWGSIAVSRKLLLLTGLFPFVGYWLIWGGTVLAPVLALAGVVAGYMAFRRFEAASFAMGLLGAVVAAFAVWYLGGFVTAAAEGVLALPEVPSRDMGGFMLNMMLGTVCVSLSLPIGIVLALGRQSDMPIIKWICVVFIEFIRGVPLITLLFVANVVLAYFLPPGTNFDLILRVIIMITMFSSAYIAEVIRGGLAALPAGQYEAADSLGLDYAQSMRLIILPQALKISIPGIVNVAVGLFKDTTLVSVISMFDLVGMIRGPILASTEWNGVYWELWGFAVVLFFVVCYGISQYSQWLERQLQRDHR